MWSGFLAGPTWGPSINDKGNLEGGGLKNYSYSRVQNSIENFVFST